jgi:hypothetical protein
MVAGVGAGVALVTTLTPAANATQGQSQLMVSPNADMSSAVINYSTVELSSNAADSNHTGHVFTQLDESCPNVFVDPSGKPNAGQKYSILTSFSPAQNSATPPATIASVAPTQPSGLICDTTTDFTITGLAPGTTTLSFTPMAANRGLQRKLSDVPATVLVVVDGGIGDFCVENPDDPSCQPQDGDRPAAPAVANMLIDGNINGAPDVSTACKAYFHNAKSWRGSTISGVAAIMPLPESKKDTDYASLVDWENAVLDMLGTVCGATFEHIA